MSVKLNTRQVGDVTVIDVSGRITLGEGSSALRDVLRDLTAKGNKKILLNLSDVSYIDSSGIGELVSGFTSVASGNPTELGLGITGQDAGNRLLGTYTAGALSGQSPRFLVNGSPQDGGTINRAAFSVPGVGQNGPYPCLTSAIRGFAIRTSRFSRTYRSAARASATFSFALRRLTF